MHYNKNQAQIKILKKENEKYKKLLVETKAQRKKYESLIMENIEYCDKIRNSLQENVKEKHGQWDSFMNKIVDLDAKAERKFENTNEIVERINTIINQ